MALQAPFAKQLIMSICVDSRKGVISHVPIKVEGLGIGEVGIGDRYGGGGPVGRKPASHAGVVVARAEVVVVGLSVALFAGELVVRAGGGGIRQAFSGRI